MTRRLCLIVLCTWVLLLHGVAEARSNLFEAPGGQVQATTVHHAVPVSELDSLRLPENSDSGLVLETYTSSGKEVICHWPHVKVAEDEKGESERDVATDSVPQHLLPLKKQCMVHLDGWWTYEFCFGRQVRQFHTNPQGKIEAEYFLGRLAEPALGVDYLHDIETNDRELLRLLESMKEDIPSGTPFYSERYKYGTPCDIAEGQRSVEIRWNCAPQATQTLIRSIKEPISCHYVMEVDSPLLCQHADYKSDTEPHHAINFYFPASPQSDLEEDDEIEVVITPKAAQSTKKQGHDEPIFVYRANAPVGDRVAHDHTHVVHHPHHTTTNNPAEHSTQPQPQGTAPAAQQNPSTPVQVQVQSPAPAVQKVQEAVLTDEQLAQQTTLLLRAAIKDRAKGRIAVMASAQAATADVTEDDVEVLDDEALEELLQEFSDAELVVLHNTIEEALKELDAELALSDHDPDEKGLIVLQLDDIYGENEDDADDPQETEPETKRQI